MADKTVIEKLSDYLLESEELSNNFLSLKDTLEPVKQDINEILVDLKAKSEESEDLGDKVFYMNRYTDLVKKVESIFDMRNKRIQNSISILSKIPNIKENSDYQDTESDNTDDSNSSDNDSNLTPEQAAKIIKILSGK